MTPREQALAQIVALAQTHQLTSEQIQTALGKPQIEANKKDGSTLTRVFTYLGGIFILSGLSAFVAMNWEYLNSAARIIITLGPGLACLIVAAVAVTKDPTTRIFNVLIVLSALLQPTGLFVAVYEFSTGGGDPRVAAALIFGVLAIQFGLVFKHFRRTVPLFFAIYFAFSGFAALCSWLDIHYDLVMFICGASLVALSYGIQRTPYNEICGFGYFVGSILLLWLGFDLLQGTMLEVLFLGLASFMLYVSTIVNSRAILITASLALLSYISYFTQKNFLDSFGWPLSLVVLGLVFFGVSKLALRLNRQLVKAA